MLPELLPLRMSLNTGLLRALVKAVSSGAEAGADPGYRGPRKAILMGQSLWTSVCDALCTSSSQMDKWGQEREIMHLSQVTWMMCLTDSNAHILKICWYT